MKRFAAYAATAAVTSLSVAAAASVTNVVSPAGVREAARAVVLTSSVDVATTAFRQIDWRGVKDPKAELSKLAGELEAAKSDPALVREVRTKLSLLSPGAEAFRPSPDASAAAGVGAAAKVPGVKGSVLGIPVVAGGVLAVPVRIFDPLRFPVVDAPVSRTAPLRVDRVGPVGFDEFRDAYAHWFRREYAVREAYFADGEQAVGRWGSRVWLLKGRLREAEGDTEYLDAAREYSRAAGVAAWRRDALKKKRAR